MRNRTGSITLLLATMLGATTVMASDLYVYPAKGQSADQQGKDEYECYQWAKRDTGFDPMAAPTASSPAPSTQQRRGGVARGALGGAAIGAIAGDSSDAQFDAAQSAAGTGDLTAFEVEHGIGVKMGSVQPGHLHCRPFGTVAGMPGLPPRRVGVRVPDLGDGDETVVDAQVWGRSLTPAPS